MDIPVKKIVVIGPESTGKSTLSQQLAEALDTLWVPEYARAYLEQLDIAYTQHDLLKIAQGQLTLEDVIAPDANKLLVCDTDLYVLKVWSEDKYGNCHPWILEQIAERKYDMYLLTDIDFEWQDDPLREHGTPAERSYFYNIYRDIVASSGLPWSNISGNPEERLQKALTAIAGLQA
jgi:NadR type nicotinamide-nucleotide adenylyltransferase